MSWPGFDRIVEAFHLFSEDLAWQRLPEEGH